MKAHPPPQIGKLADKYGYKVFGDRGIVSLQDESTRINVNLDLRDDRPSPFVYLYVRTTSWDLGGERTDANEFISVMLAVFFRVELGISASLWDIPHPTGFDMPETEIYARYIVLDQPSDSEYDLTEAGIDGLEKVVRAVRQFEVMMPRLLDWTVTGEGETAVAEQGWGWAEASEWAREVSEATGDLWVEREWDEGIRQMVPPELLEPSPSPEGIQYSWRQNPDWRHYRCIQSGLTVFEMSSFPTALAQRLESESPWEVLDGPSSKLYVSGATRNAASVADIDMLSGVAKALEGDTSSSVAVIPLENILVASSANHLFFLNREAGRKPFEAERELIRTRHRKEAAILFPPVGFEWQPSLNDSDFELLTLDLLKREPGVSRARLVSNSNDPDGGRDILCDWVTPPIPGSYVPDKTSPLQMRNIVVQCKAYSRAVNKSNVQDIRDTVEHHSAHGYFLAVSSHLTSPLTNHLDRMRQQGRLWVDWWTRSEIEDRLSKHPDLCDKYPEVVRCIRQPIRTAV